MRKFSRAWLVFIGISALVVGCGSEDRSPVEIGEQAPAPTPTSSSDDQRVEVTLGVGDSTTLDGVVVTFAGVVEDSRCPIGLTCVWEGDGVVKIVVASDERRDQLLLHTASLGPRSARIAGKLFTLLDLAPYPHGNYPIPPSSYRIDLAIEEP